jgi:hypothetical protein
VDTAHIIADIGAVLQHDAHASTATLLHDLGAVLVHDAGGAAALAQMWA